MSYYFEGKSLESFFGMSEDYCKDHRDFDRNKNLISIIWNRNDKNVSLVIDNIPVELKPDQISTTTFHHRIKFDKKSEPLTVFAFNKPFYCIQDHDKEVSCNGILFYGTLDPPIITLPESEIAKFDFLYQVFLDEFQTRDNIQGEMLQMLLKRLIIKVTRLAKMQLLSDELNQDNQQVDTIRMFNLLVDEHFRELKQVSEYANLLNKSPKTLSNLFAKNGHRSPLSIIHERTMLEAKRMLMYTDKSAKEISYELGFEDAAYFHKKFKQITGQTPQQFKTDHSA